MRSMRIVNVIPHDLSNETNADSEPSIAVNPSNPNEMVITTEGTPADGHNPNGPFFYSMDGGETWYLRYDIPGQGNGDESPAFAASSHVYIGTLPFADDDSGPGDEPSQMDLLRIRDIATGPQVVSLMNLLRAQPNATTIDQPWTEAITANGRDHLFVGYNLHHNGNAQAMVDVYVDASSDPPRYQSVVLDSRLLNDGYEIRPTAHADGTVYVAFKSVISPDYPCEVNVVVVRDDSWGSGDRPFTALKDPGDHLPGRLVEKGVHIAEAYLGSSDGVDGDTGIHLNNDLNIAVDPTKSDVVYLVWGDSTHGSDFTAPNTLRVRRSTNRGVDWSDDLLTIQNAALACLAINDRGTVGLLYQQLVRNTIETHFRTTADGTNWDDTLLARTDLFNAFAGDYARIVAVGSAFYGVFPAMNTPDPRNFFPHGDGTWRYQRNTGQGQLLGLDGRIVSPSVDPFFFKVVESD